MTLSPVVKNLLRYLALAYVGILVIVPVALILWRTFAPGIGAFFESITTPAALSALQLSLLVVAIVVPLNVLFGVPTALVLARNRFRGKNALQAIIDLPFAVSPVVVGVALILLWGSAGLLGFVEQTLTRPPRTAPDVTFDFWHQFDQFDRFEELRQFRPALYRALPIDEQRIANSESRTANSESRR